MKKAFTIAAGFLAAAMVTEAVHVYNIRSGIYAELERSSDPIMENRTAEGRPDTKSINQCAATKLAYTQALSEILPEPYAPQVDTASAMYSMLYCEATLD